MLFDRVDSVRRSAAEQLVMAARIDLDRCPSRLLHHIPGACSRQPALPTLSQPLPPIPAAGGRTAALPAISVAGPGSAVAGSRDADAVASGEQVLASNISGSAAGLDGNGNTGLAGPVAEAGSSGSLVSEAAASAKPGGGDGKTGKDADDDADDDDDDEAARTKVEEQSLGGDDTGAFEEGSPPPLPSPSCSPEGQATGEDAVLRETVRAGSEEAEGRISRGGVMAVEPLDRAAGCGLWLRLVIMPLMTECLEGSYRTKLLALHMTQVRQEGRVAFFAWLDVFALPRKHLLFVLGAQLVRVTDAWGVLTQVLTVDVAGGLSSSPRLLLLIAISHICRRY